MKIETLATEGPSLETGGTTTEVLEQLLPELILLDSDEFCSLFNISPRTAFEYRRDGLISYIRIHGRLYYRLADVMDFMTQFSYKNNSQTAKQHETN